MARARRGSVRSIARAVSQLLWPDKDREVWFSLGENHEKAYRFPDFLQRGTGREQRCATFFEESRMQFGSSNDLYRKSGFGLHQLRNCFRLTRNKRVLEACGISEIHTGVIWRNTRLHFGISSVQSDGGRRVVFPVCPVLPPRAVTNGIESTRTRRFAPYCGRASS